MVHVQTNTINLMDTSIQVHSNSTSFTDIPGTVNHATKNETAKITDIPYKADTVNHATRLKRQRLLTYFGTWLWYGTEETEEEKRGISCKEG